MDDFVNASYPACEGVLKRFVYHLDEEPLASLLRATLPPVDFPEWIEQAKGTVGSSVGSGVLNWPAPRPERVALQIALCRSLVAGKLSFLNFVHEYFNSGRAVQASIVNFAHTLLLPLVRDIRRIAEQRPIDVLLSGALDNIKGTGDSVLDGLLKDAVSKFKDPSPKLRLEASQVLWDAWERLKTLDVSEDKKQSVKLLLDRATTDASMRALLEAEARELTRIGNDFHIRHFEADRTAIERPEHVDYLFHRLFAFIQVLLKFK